MKLKNVLFVFLVLIVLISLKTDVFAQWEVDIDADYSYKDKIREVIIAKGNVRAKAKDFYLESPYVKYYYKEHRIVAEDKFFIDIEGYRIYGSKLEYNYRTDTGVAGIVRINFGNTYLGGSFMRIRKGKLSLQNAYFTGCNKSESDYHVSANELILYPETGLLVAYWATAWIGAAPVIPVPTFVYSAEVPVSKFGKKPKRKISAYERRMKRLQQKKQLSPVPKFGTNSEDGLFLEQGFNWYLDKRSYAKFLLRFMGNNGVGIGLKKNYILRDGNEGEVRLARSDGDGFFGGITHIYSFGPKILSKEDEKWLIYDTYRPGNKYAYEIDATYSHRERINRDKNEGPFNRVSMTPKVAIRSNRQPFPYLGKPFSYYLEANTAQVSEEPTSVSTIGAESERQQFYVDIGYDKNLGILGDFHVGWDYDSIQYSTLNRFWQKSTQKVELKNRYFDRLDLNLGHVHYFHQGGNGSPFTFDQYEYSPFDQFMYTIGYDFWWSRMSIDSVHDLPTMDPFSVNYAIKTGMHCYDLTFNYKIIRRPTERTEFSFSFDFANSRWIEKKKYNKK